MTEDYTHLDDCETDLRPKGPRAFGNESLSMLPWRSRYERDRCTETWNTTYKHTELKLKSTKVCWFEKNLWDETSQSYHGNKTTERMITRLSP